MAYVPTEPLRTSLVNAGWDRGRRWPHGDEARKYLAELGMRVDDALGALLSSVGGLSIRRDGAGQRAFGIDPWCPEVDVVDGYSEDFEIRLFPLGFTEDGESSLVVDEEGRVAELTLDGLLFYGDSIESALEALILGESGRLERFPVEPSEPPAQEVIQTKERARSDPSSARSDPSSESTE